MHSTGATHPVTSPSHPRFGRRRVSLVACGDTTVRELCSAIGCPRAPAEDKRNVLLASAKVKTLALVAQKLAFVGILSRIVWRRRGSAYNSYDEPEKLSGQGDPGAQQAN
jgi:hypothetical protein